MTTMTAAEILKAIQPKSDQLNGEDLMASGPRDVTIAGVSSGSTEQPVNIRLENEARYYRPCKTMTRVLVSVWGNNGHEWVGKRLRLFYEPNVKFGGVVVGGIRISHLSGIKAPHTVALSVTKGKKAPWTVHPIPDTDTRKDRGRAHPGMIEDPQSPFSHEPSGTSPASLPEQTRSEPQPPKAAISSPPKDGAAPSTSSGVDLNATLEVGHRQAARGYAALEAWGKALSKEARDAVRPHWADLATKARAADLVTETKT